MVSSDATRRRTTRASVVLMCLKKRSEKEGDCEEERDKEGCCRGGCGWPAQVVGERRWQVGF